MTCAHVWSRHGHDQSPFFPILLRVDDSLSKHYFLVLIEVGSCRGNYRSLELRAALNVLLFDLHRSTKK